MTTARPNGAAQAAALVVALAAQTDRPTPEDLATEGIGVCEGCEFGFTLRELVTCIHGGTFCRDCGCCEDCREVRR